jgi:hypothetical protein
VSIVVAGPTPGLDPDAVRRAAAIAYVDAADAARKRAVAAARLYRPQRTLRAARTYCRSRAEILGDLIAAIRAIEVPRDAAQDLHRLIIRHTATQSLYIEASAIKSRRALESVTKALVKAERVWKAAANPVRSDVGLPPVRP